jgi:hypothetical protein
VGKPVSKVANFSSDLVFGAKSPGTWDKNIDVVSGKGREIQEKALGQYGEELGVNTNAIAQNQIAQQENQARQGAIDLESRARQMVAQRGLGNTAMGMNAMLGGQRDLANQIGGIRAGAPELERALRQRQLGFVSGGVNDILSQQSGSKIFMPGQQSVRGTGLLHGLAGAIGQGAGQAGGQKMAGMMAG